MEGLGGVGEGGTRRGLEGLIDGDGWCVAGGLGVLLHGHSMFILHYAACICTLGN